ncbi:MAG: Hsp20/alpha crystallin family protein [Burkholderiales bacterium]
MARIIKANPVREVQSFDPFGGRRGMSAFLRDPPWYGSRDSEMEIAVDIDESEDTYFLKANVPGAKKQDIDISIEGDQVVITAKVDPVEIEQKGVARIVRERFRGTQSRRIFLDADVDANKAVATYHEGVLDLRLPKKPGSGGKKIAIR